MTDRLCVSVRIDPVMIPYLYRQLMPIAYRLSESVVAPSQGVSNALQKLGVPARNLSVISNPVGKQTDVITSAHVGFPKRFILGVGRLERQKGFDRLLTAFAKMDQSDIQIVILGHGTERTALLAMSQQLEIRSLLRLPGAVSDVDAWYRRAECFVLTSHYEGSPNVVVEAMANGCPVVSSIAVRAGRDTRR